MTATLELPYRVLTATQGTPEWLRHRQCGVGASEAAAILGDSHWGTPYSIWEQKLAEDVVDETTDLMEFGHLAEDVIVAFMALHPERFDYLGRIVASPGLLQSVEWPWLLGSLDRQCITPDGTVVPVELKSVNDHVAREWKAGETGDDEDSMTSEYGGDYVVPRKYQVQVQQQMAVTGAPFAYVVAWLGKDKLTVIRVDRDDEFIATYLIGELGDFWEFYVQGRTAPPLTINDDLWKVLPGERGLVVPADEELYDWIGQWRIATTDARELKKDIADLKFKIAMRMGQGTEVMDPETEEVIHTLRGQRTARKVDLVTLELKYPDAYAECVGEPGWTRVHRATKEPVG